MNNIAENTLPQIRDKIGALSVLSHVPKNESIIAMKIMANDLIKDLNSVLKNIRYSKE